MDTVLTATRPELSDADAVELSRACFGVTAAAARDLGSERDRTFALDDAGGDRVAILKVSNASEDPDVLDMEAEVALHVMAADPGLRVAVPWRAAADSDPARPARSGDAVAALRARWTHGDSVHWARLYDVLPGHSRIEAARLSDAALIAWGETTARLDQALRGFTHPRARRTMLWDVQHALAARSMLGDIRDARQRTLVAGVLDEFERTVTPVWPRLRAQVVHTDLSVDNTVTDDAGLITGIIDFGDMSHTALMTELASVLDSLGVGREGDELFRLARLVLDGFQARTELEDLELEVLGVMWAARSAVTIAISSWRVAQGLEEREFAERYNAQCAGMLATMEEVGWPEVARRLGADLPRAGDEPSSLEQRRTAAFGPAMEALFYDVPVEVARAQGVWITDSAGRRLLDVYNNVPCVGHGHPRVTAAVARQGRRINTHMRYLHPAAIELAERLTALCPPELDTVLLVNSGSEANDLAWRMATAVTGRRGGLCTAYAYHGITEATEALSPESWFDTPPRPHIERWEPPDSYRAEHLDGAGFAAAVDRLRARDCSPAAAILDGLIMSDRIDDLPAAYVQELVARTHDAGALWIADEVQAGHGRTGAMWAFERFGVVPDFVTLGKPMGNGHPVAAVITRREIVQALAGHTVLFSTYGGNPVSAAAALAVLDVIEDERVLERVQASGRALREGLAELAGAHDAIGHVRGAGLACGVEIVADRAARTPDGDRARRVRDRLRHHGVLIGTTGRSGNILKLRPPLAFTVEHVPALVSGLDASLAETEPRR
ncbi:MAG TPA: aminotransferase class III-fold pyridoxal phosphate-dependent enzyme [Solirubrobacteraceae bacterium]|nr:aminotransferase class III-fold pyridoxal phosphate-dependent enzyme [Solirubrobacteraceae bacterium]